MADLRKLESNLYRVGLCGGFSVCTVEHNGKQLKLDSFNFYPDRNILVEIWSDRAPSGLWCIPKEIRITNKKTGKVWNFMEGGGNNNADDKK